MIYICQHPRIIYYAWMVEAMLYQGEKIGMDLSSMHILCGYSPIANDLSNRPDVVEMWRNLERRFPEANFFYYEDSRDPITYIPSIIPHLLKKHFRQHRWLEKETVFLHDCDMIFTKKPDYSDLENDNINWMSDSRSFINYDYINHNRPEDLYLGMCDVVGIDPEIPKRENDNSGGSQYIYKGVTSEFWAKVERDSVNLHKFFQETEPIRNQTIPGYYGIQQFAAGMWAFLWNIWFFGGKTGVTKRLDFCWGTDLVEKWNETEIFHNAGATETISNTNNLFYKGFYTNKLPYEDIRKREYNPLYASSKYVELLRECSENTCLIKK